ncbi:hypothetical protein RJT34_03895 [Clitoria ternatea]|uniref:Uncharacterized protein n=1 Tax=Clitoria ternatea TaxID=43366 RepID=A0AAN9KN16_CLITE
MAPGLVGVLSMPPDSCANFCYRDSVTRKSREVTRPKPLFRELYIHDFPSTLPAQADFIKALPFSLSFFLPSFLLLCHYHFSSSFFLSLLVKLKPTISTSSPILVLPYLL